MKKIWACLAAAFLAALMAAPAGAAPMAPSYVSSQPEDGEELHEAPERVEVTFSEPLDESSQLSVEDSCGRKVDTGEVSVDGSTMSVGIALKPSGHYQVSYTATGVAGVTGSTEGGFHFMVHFGEACGKDGGVKGGNGGHNNHGGNGGNNTGGGNQHNNHGGGGGTDHNTGGGGGHTSSGHTTTGGTSTHSGMSGHDSSMGAGGRDHSEMQHGGGHKKKEKSHGKHNAHRKPKTPDDPGGRTIAAGPGRPVPPDGRAVLLALGFSLALGSVGGWFLRVSAAR